MEEEDKMRPVIFKGGQQFGKVLGIRGLYREASGRWFVRASCSGIDRQKTVVVNENATFSGLERAASTALKALKKEIDAELEKRPKDEKNEKKINDPIKRGQKQLEGFVKTFFAKSPKNVTRRLGQCSGFALARTSKDCTTIDAHNATLMRKLLEERKGTQSALEYWKGIHAVFASAKDAGEHAGLNPATKILRPADMTEKDYGSLSMQQLATVFKAITANTLNTDSTLIQQVKCFFYLLCTGMRSTSAILFRSSDIETVKGINGKKKYYYRVFNNKRSQKMPYKQLISKHIIDDLKKIDQFTYSIKTFQNTINAYIKYCYPQSKLCCKHLRKSFINLCVEDGKFPLFEVGLITHLSPAERGQNVTIVKNYYSKGQNPCDRIMTWFNKTLFALIQNTESPLSKEKFVCNNVKLQNIMLKRKIRKMKK